MKRTAIARKAPLRANTTASLTLRLKRCKNCRQGFKPAASFQVYCRAEACALAALKAVQEKRKKAEAKEHREKLQASKPRGYWVDRAQAAFNLFVRLRDAGQPCICCGKPFEPDKPGGSVDAGHYLSRGSAPNLRFNEDNCHAQRKNCNRPGGTTREAFRAGVIARIGLARVEALEGPHPPAKWSIEELKAIRDHYTAKARLLKDAA